MGRQHISISEREIIMIRVNEGAGPVQIAREIGRDKGTISRELVRNATALGGYSAHQADAFAAMRRALPRRGAKMADPRIRAYAQSGLCNFWSPEQIAGRMKEDHPHDASMRVCHETVYQFIGRQKQAGVDFTPYLRQRHARNGYGWRGHHRFKRIREARSIEQRPAEVEKREQAGHWEGDTMRGAGNSPVGIGTQVERMTRYLVAELLNTRKAATYNQATCAAFAAQPGLPRLSLTVDNGMEFAEHKALEKELGVLIYFARPYHAWERGTNENTNGLLRQFFPKGADLGAVSEAELQRVVALLNNRPRKCLGYRTAAEAMSKALVAFRN